LSRGFAKTGFHVFERAKPEEVVMTVDINKHAATSGWAFACAGVAICALLTASSLPSIAQAQHGGGHGGGGGGGGHMGGGGGGHMGGGGDRGGGGFRGGGDHRGGGGGGWGGGYYDEPGLVFGSPYYCDPPLIYGGGYPGRYGYNGCY
jgi:hypothetical protein